MTNITENATKLEIFGKGSSATTREIAMKNMPGPGIIDTGVQIITDIQFLALKILFVGIVMWKLNQVVFIIHTIYRVYTNSFNSHSEHSR